MAEIAGPEQQLLLIGDGQQQLYPGGYTLSEAGVSITGRSTVLRVNYRNCAEILTAAAQVVADDDFEDLDGPAEQGRRDIATARPGGQVWRIRAGNIDELRGLAVAHVRSLVDTTSDSGGIVILCETNAEVERYVAVLGEAGVRAIKLSSYNGVPADAVKVGTVQRAKGLEFKHVVYALHDRAASRRLSEDAAHEERERANRTLFVAMTRARDSVWVGRVA